MPHCDWSKNKCAYSDDDYCSSNDSYCEGMECCRADTCCPNDFDEPIGNQLDCDLISGVWLPQKYLDEESCRAADFDWQKVSHGFIDYSYREKCEDNNPKHEWVEAEYLNKESCLSVGYDWEIVYFAADTTWSSWNPNHFPGLEYGEDLRGYPSFESPKLFESFTDYNVNGICDYDAISGSYEPFTDADGSDENQNGICDEVGDWSSRCPDNANNCLNVVVIEAGYKASNITYPSDTPEIDFIIPDPGNTGNGDRLYNIVNEYDLTGAILRFEINAGLDRDSYGDANGSFATLSPGLFAYEVISMENLTPKTTSEIPLQNLDDNSLDSLLNLPGTSTDNVEFISIPNYKIEDFKLTAVDNPLYESNYTDWFDGIQFRFDNGPDGFTNDFQIAELKEVIYSDPLLEHMIDIKMRYKSETDLQKRLMYRYKIEFSSSFVDNAAEVAPSTACYHMPDSIGTPLPFRVKNLATGNYVKMQHSDRGINGSLKDYGEVSQGNCSPNCSTEEDCIESKCITKIGNKDCNWENNELVSLIDTVYTTNNPAGSGETVFQLKINFNYFAYAFSYIPNFFQIASTTGVDWISGTAYENSDIDRKSVV